MRGSATAAQYGRGGGPQRRPGGRGGPLPTAASASPSSGTDPHASSLKPIVELDVSTLKTTNALWRGIEGTEERGTCFESGSTATTLRSNLSGLQWVRAAALLCDVEVEPLVDMPRTIISDTLSVGPYTRGVVVRETLDLALSLVTINVVVPMPPSWLSPEELKRFNNDEKRSATLLPPPHPYYIELAAALFNCGHNVFQSKRTLSKTHLHYKEYRWTREDKIDCLDEKLIMAASSCTHATIDDLSNLSKSELLRLGAGVTSSEQSRLQRMYDAPAAEAALLPSLRSVLRGDYESLLSAADRREIHSLSMLEGPLDAHSTRPPSDSRPELVRSQSSSFF
eukprot:GHVU01100565.1.p1 GENE.GHVU01100565.1~~GHVU01100565.1.p1  ORF type:complete len:339 (+),score=54.86 GHVU01100565.1:187-1203(+)